MKTAVMYGAGNIGRGFIGALFSASGYRTVFIDVAAPVVEALNRDHAYPVRILSGTAHEDLEVTNVCAVDGTDTDAVRDAIASADLMATAVGVNVLPKIVPNIIEGLRRRKEKNPAPLNLLICENLMDANRVLWEMIQNELSPEEIPWFEENLGLVETSIGRMVPVQTEEMKDGNPLRVCVEPYGFLPVDREAFKGAVPEIHNMIPFSPFDFYVKRKLYIHNMGHAVCAYLGDLLGLEYVYQSIDRDDVYILVKDAMEESALALSRQYKVPLEGLLEHIRDLLFRFTNAALKDTCKRVGGDPKRKLSPADRLVGAVNLAEKNGIFPAYIMIGIAAALHRYLREEALSPTQDNAAGVLREICKIDPKTEAGQTVLEYFISLSQKQDLHGLRNKADEKKAEKSHQTV